MHLGRAAGCTEPERHVGVLGVGDDELAAARVGVDRGELAVEGFLHDVSAFPCCPEMVTRELTGEPLPPACAHRHPHRASGAPFVATLAGGRGPDAPGLTLPAALGLLL